MTKAKDPIAELDRVRRKIRLEGVDAAATALIEVCQDKSAPAPARATAATTIFRSAGMFDATDGGAEKQPHEMTLGELEEQRAELERRRAAADDDDPGDGGVFE